MKVPLPPLPDLCCCPDTCSGKVKVEVEEQCKWNGSVDSDSEVAGGGGRWWLAVVSRCRFLAVPRHLPDCSVALQGGARLTSGDSGRRLARHVDRCQEAQQIVLFTPNQLLSDIWELNIDDFQYLVDFFYILVCHMFIWSILKLQMKSVKMPER